MQIIKTDVNKHWSRTFTITVANHKGSGNASRIKLESRIESSKDIDVVIYVRFQMGCYREIKTGLGSKVELQ